MTLKEKFLQMTEYELNKKFLFIVSQGGISTKEKTHA